MLTARNSNVASEPPAPGPARALLRLTATTAQLCRRLGLRHGMVVAAQLLHHGESIRFPDNGRWYHIRHEANVATHILSSTPKLRRLADVVSAEDAVIIDIGAHSGLFATFAKERSPDALVIVVEPDPKLRPIIERNLKPFGAWKLIQAAVSSQSGRSNFYRNAHATQTSSLFADSAQTFAGEIERLDVEVTTLDSIVARLETPQIDVLKLDVQGAERLVLEGGAASLSGVRKLIIEVTFLDPDPGALLTFLAGEFGAPQTLNPVYMGADLVYRRAAHA